MNVMLASAYAATQPGPAAGALIAAARGPAPYRLVTDADAADLILFVEYHPGHDPYFFHVLRHPLRRRYPHKCVLYTDADRVIPLMPMLAPSLERWQQRRSLCRAFPYVTREYRNEELEKASPAVAPRLLFSFIGASDTHPLRARILALREPDALLVDAGRQRGWLLSGPDKAAYERRYVEACLDSHFVLCPRGAGPTSYRLYEAMQLGRAPVVISDAWVPHEGPQWPSFSVHIAERDVERIGAILREHVGAAGGMGARARREWEAWVAPPVALHRLIAVAAELANAPQAWFDPALRWAQFVHPFHLRNLGRWLVRLRHLAR